MINLKIDPEFQSQIPPLTDDEFKQLEENILKEGKLISPLIVWGNTLVDGHNRYEIVQEHPEISFSTMPLPFESREEVLAWICKNQLGRRNLTPEQKKFLMGKQYSSEKRTEAFRGNQHTAKKSGSVQGYPFYLLLFIKSTAQIMVNDTWEITPPDVAVLYKPGQRHLYRANHTEYEYQYCLSAFLISAVFPHYLYQRCHPKQDSGCL